jgi:uncharacterized protein
MLTTLLTVFLAAIALPPKPDHFVTDHAGVLASDRATAIDEKLKSFEKSTSTQIIVYIDKKIPEGTTLEEMGAQAIHEWGVGQKGKDNGAIVFIFTDDHKMRIEVGYGLEGSITDARAKLITSELMKPKIRQGDYAGAVDAAVNAMMNFTPREDYKGTGHTVAEANVATTNNSPLFLLFPLLMFLGIGGFIIFMLTYGKKKGWVRGSPGYAGGDSSWSSSSSSDSDSGGGGGGGDFGGGGGDGGGGGSSDSW